MRKLPPLNAIRAFEAAARNRSFTSAANELCVTVTAVSHQIKNLEDQIGRKLFDRTPREVRLTAVGERLFPLLRDGFDRFAEAFDEIGNQRSGQSITVSTTRAFAERWLMPRLEHFNRIHPDVIVNVEGTEEVADLYEQGIDLAIRYGRTADPSLTSISLLNDHYMAVCRRDGMSAAPQVTDFKTRGLLAYRWKQRADDFPSWARWMQMHGLDGLLDYRVCWYNDESLAMHAMERGMGPLLCSNVLVADSIQTGVLQALEGPVLEGFGFRIVHPPMRRMKRSLADFIDWLRQEAALYEHALLPISPMPAHDRVFAL
jgi:LysR family transcriptional regulator, glycine cleavage system transcriptional activator